MPVPSRDPFDDTDEGDGPLARRLMAYEKRAAELIDFCMDRTGEAETWREMRNWVELARKCIVTAADIAQAARAPAQLDHVERELKRVEARIADVRGGHRTAAPAAPGGSSPTWKRN